MVRSRRGAGILVLAVITAGCSGDGSTAAPHDPSPLPSTSAAPAPSATGSPVPAGRSLVTVATSGGFAGLQESVVVNEDGSYTLRSGGKPAGAGRLSPARLAELRAALEESDFRSLPPQRTGGGSSVFDAITYTITYEGHRVVTSDPLPAPALRRIIAAVPHRDGR